MTSNFRITNVMLDFSKPKIMGVINITPDSFFNSSRVQDPSEVLRRAEDFIQQGADIIDIGAEPTNPSLHPCVSLEEELDRIAPVLELLSKNFDAPISVDTSKPEVMGEAIKQGAKIINDVRALSRPGAIEAVANADVMVCLMHMSYPEGKDNLCIDPESGLDVISRVKQYLHQRIDDCIEKGIKRENIIIDPGIGAGNFGKSTKENLTLIKGLNEFKSLKSPILVGVSRKTFIGDILKNDASERLAGSLAATSLAIANGANIIRTHDVKATADAVNVTMEILNANL